MARSKKWMRTSLTRWLKHSINLQSKNPQSKPPQDGNPTQLMTRNPTTHNTSKNTIKRNYQHLSPVPTADAPFRPNPIYQNIVKPTFVWGKDASVEIQNFLNNNHFCWEGFYVEVQPQSQKSQQATRAQKYLIGYRVNGRGYKVETFNRNVIC